MTVKANKEVCRRLRICPASESPAIFQNSPAMQKSILFEAGL